MPPNGRKTTDPHGRSEKTSRKYVDPEPKDNATITRYAPPQNNTFKSREDLTHSRRDRDADRDPDSRSRDVAEGSRQGQHSYRRERPSERELPVLSQSNIDRNSREQTVQYRDRELEYVDYITPQNKTDGYRQEQHVQRRRKEVDHDPHVPLQSSTDRTQSRRNQRDRSRETVPDSPRANRPSNPTVLTSQPDLPDDVSESDSAENDALRGLTPSAKIFLNYNIVSGDFINQSVEYLKRNQPMMRRQDVAEWRERGRSALRMGNAELARKLIQQAWLIELWQKKEHDGVQKFLEKETMFADFIKQTYPTFLYFLEEAESEGRFDRRRAQMLEPWVTFVSWVCGEDISQTLSSTPRSESRSWVSDFVAKATNSSPSPQAYTKDNVRSSAPQLQRPNTGHRTSADDKRQFLSHNTASYSGGAATVVPSSAYPGAILTKMATQQFSTGTNHRPSATGRTERKEMTDRGSGLAQTQSNVDDYPSRTGSRQPLQIEPSRRRLSTTEKDETDSSDESESSDGSGDDSRDRLHQDRVVKRATRKGKEAEVSDDEDETREDLRYIHTRGPVPPQSEPRRMKTDLPNHTRPTTMKPPTATPPPNPISRLPGLLLQFFGMRTHQECWKYCERYTQIFDEDIALFQNVAMDCLRQGREQTATQVIERWVMLRNAKNAQEGPEQYMKRLPIVAKRQQDLKQDCDKVLKALRERLQAAGPEERPSSSLPSQGSGQRPSVSAPQRQGIQPEHRSKQTKPVKS